MRQGQRQAPSLLTFYYTVKIRAGKQARHLPICGSNSTSICLLLDSRSASLHSVPGPYNLTAYLELGLTNVRQTSPFSEFLQHILPTGSYSELNKHFFFCFIFVEMGSLYVVLAVLELVT